jgi:hypothetical protein
MFSIGPYRLSYFATKNPSILVEESKNIIESLFDQEVESKNVIQDFSETIPLKGFHIYPCRNFTQKITQTFLLIQALNLQSTYKNCSTIQLEIEDEKKSFHLLEIDHEIISIEQNPKIQFFKSLFSLLVIIPRFEIEPNSIEFIHQIDEPFCEELLLPDTFTSNKFFQETGDLELLSSLEELVLSWKITNLLRLLREFELSIKERATIIERIETIKRVVLEARAERFLSPFRLIETVNPRYKTAETWLTEIESCPTSPLAMIRPKRIPFSGVSCASCESPPEFISDHYRKTP